MRTRSIELVQEQLERYIEVAESNLNKTDVGDFAEWINSPITEYLKACLEATILSNMMAWQSGVLHTRVSEGDQEAESRARHHIECLENVMSYLSDFEELKEMKEKLDKRGDIENESDRTQDSHQEATDSGEY